MDEAFQRAYLETEHDHWWTRGRRDIIVRLLAELEVQDFEDEARQLQGVWTDEVIEKALRLLEPDEGALAHAP